MLNVRDNEIYLTRGDTAYITIELYDESGEAYKPVSGDKIYFRLKKDIFGKTLLLMKEVNPETLTFELKPEDTNWLEFSSYRYEIELVTVNGKCFTVVESSPFVVGVELEVHDV